MPMTLNEWKAWSPEKRTFYAELFASYVITDDGMLRIDAVKRRELIRAQLAKQAKGGEQIITRNNAANYVVTDGLQPDGRTIRPVAEANQVQLLCSQRGDLKTMQSMFQMQDGVSALDLVQQADEAAANKEPIQHSLVGGFMPEGKTTQEHFSDAVSLKMRGGQKSNILNQIELLSLGEYDDLSFMSRCSLDPNEMQFLLRDEDFIRPINAEARRLSNFVMKGTMTAEAIAQQILAHIRLCSAQQSNQKSLAELSVPRVGNYMAMCTSQQFRNLSAYACDNLSIVGKAPNQLGFKGETKRLPRFIVDGLLEFTFPPEFRNVIKASFLLKSQFAGQNINDVRDQTANFVVQGELVRTLTTMLVDATKEQVNDIKAGSLPQPPADMGIQWDIRRTPGKILNILRAQQCLDLFNIAEMGGFSRDQAHLAFGLQSKAVVDSINQEIQKIWEEQTPDLLKGIESALKRIENEMQAFWRNNGDDALRGLKRDAQPSGIKLAVVPPVAVVAAPPVAYGFFGNNNNNAPNVVVEAAAVVVPAANNNAPKTKTELAREAAQLRLQAKAQEEAAKRRADQLAEVELVVQADDADDDERRRMQAN